MKIIIHTFLIVLIAVFASCGDKDKRTELENLKKQQAEIRKQIALLEKELAATEGYTPEGSGVVATTLMATAPFVHKIEVQAKVEGEQNVTVNPDMPGTISRVLVQTGDQVRKGQLLLELENSVVKQSLSELQTQREFAAVLFEKQKSLWDQRIGTEVQFLQAKNNLASIDKKMATVNQQLELSRVKSPIDGTVDAVDVRLGQMFSPGMPGLRVVNFTDLKVVADVAEGYINTIDNGDSVEVYFPDTQESILTRIVHSGKVIDNLNRTFKVEVSLAGSKSKLHPNQVAVLRIIDYKKNDAIILPIDVVQNTPEGSYVFTNMNGKAKKTMVTTGKSYNGKIEIKEGLNPGDAVVTSGYQDLSDGQDVNP
jgi:RND family efflux transporter MFP subunit